MFFECGVAGTRMRECFWRPSDLKSRHLGTNGTDTFTCVHRVREGYAKCELSDLAF